MIHKFISLISIFAAVSLREEQSNSGGVAVRETAVANALDPDEAIDFSDDADGWFKIAPYGEFRGKTPGRPQHVGIENARAMESEFNSVLGKLGRAFRGVPIYHGHPDVDPETWTDDRRIGKITKLDARNDGLWGFAEWNSVGKENKAEGWWIYPSPRWDAPPGQTRFAPDRLISVGLTNTPRIQESEPVHNSQLDENNNDTTTMDQALLRKNLGLPPEATDEEVLAKIEALTAAATASEATNTAIAAAKTEKDALENSITQLREAHNNSVLDRAIETGRITAAERPQWASRLSGTARETEINSLTALAPKLNKDGLDLGDRRGERKQGDDLREQVANAIEAYKKDGMSHHEAHLKAKKNPAFKAYFDRTEG